MSDDRQLDSTIGSWLEAEAPGQLPDRVLRATFERTHRTRQQAGWRALPGRIDMTRLIYAVGALAAVGVLAVAGLGLYANRPAGVGTQPTPSPTATPAPTATPSPTAKAPGGGKLQPGTYFLNPLPAPNTGLTLTYTVPAGWEAFGPGLIPSGDPSTGAPGGIALQFIDVTSLNGDPCHWSATTSDVSVGPRVDDLVQALRAQTAYEVSEPVDVSIGGYNGKRVDIVGPTAPFRGYSSEAPACDDGVVRLWSTAAHGKTNIYLQGPANRWQANILDIDGTRLVIIAQDFPGTSPEDRAELDAIVDSMVIEP